MAELYRAESSAGESVVKNGRQGEGGGKPKAVLSDDQVVQVEKLAAMLSKGQLADYFGICENTFREIEKRQPEVSEAYKKGRGKALASVASSLIKQAQSGNTAAAIFYLKTQGRWKEASQMEVTGRDGNDLRINLVNYGSHDTE